jgi:NADH-quinone oxidoreductase subunit M
VAFANIALPLTNAFPGEFMMLSGLYEVKTWYAIVAGLAVILSAAYTLNMIQKVFYGHTNDLTQTVKDIAWNEKLALTIIVAFVFVLGIYPQPLIELTKESVAYLLTTIRKTHVLKHFFIFRNTI